MCGIGGVWCFEGRELSKEDGGRIEELSYALEVRGEDAFGFYDGVKVVKFPGRASEVIPQISKIVEFESLVEGKRMFLVHTRAATQGDPLKNKNNHPFETKDFVLAHNGAVYQSKKYLSSERELESVIRANKDKSKKWIKDNYEVLDFEGIFGKKWEEIPDTDSFEIAVEVQKEFNEIEDPVTAFKNAMIRLFGKGSYAIWIYSKTHDLLMLFRDVQPLFYSIEDGKLWFASENYMLRGIGLKKVKPLKSGVIYVFDRTGEIDKIQIGEIYDERLGISCENVYNYCKAADYCLDYKRKYLVTLCDDIYCPLNNENEEDEEDIYLWKYYYSYFE